MVAQPAELRFGTAGWSYPDWDRVVYQGSPQRGLELLATVFDVVEVNSTFYRVPAPSSAVRWLGRVAANPRFLFTAKLWQGFTHQREFAAADVDRFAAALSPLVHAGKLGALLAQFPWSFRRDATAERYVARLARLFDWAPLVLEVRHDSWAGPEVASWCESLNVSLCNIDQPIFVGSLAPAAAITASIGYVRLHGRNRDAWFRDGAGRDERYHYRYSPAELRPWAERVRTVQARADAVFVITNNHFEGNAVMNGLELAHLCDGVKRTVPGAWLASFPRLRASCRGRGAVQGELFAPAEE